MFIGDTSRFALESGITKAYERLGFRALGFFVIWICGKRYGVCAPDATLLACSFDAVRERIVRRSEHKAPFSQHPNGGQIADAYRDAIYAPDQENSEYFGISYWEFREILFSNDIQWAPDGDEAFDDWSHVLQFDVGNDVRLIAFRSEETGYHHSPETLADITIPADEFYGVLSQWSDAFEQEWIAAPKISESEDGAEGGRC